MLDTFAPGLVCFGIGLLLYTIGGLMGFAHKPGLFDPYVRKASDPSGKPAPVSNVEQLDALLNNPKGKWFSRIGVAMVWVGMGLLMAQFPTQEVALPFIGWLAAPFLLWRTMRPKR